MNGGEQGQCLHGGVAVQLNVLAFNAQHLQQSVGQDVLAHALIADQKYVLAELIVFQHLLQDLHVLWDFEEQNIWHQRGIFRLVSGARNFV